MFPGAKIGCWHKGRLLTGPMNHSIQCILYSDDLDRYLFSKYGWSDDTNGLIDWAAHKSLIEGTPIYHRATLMKNLHGWLATKKR